MKLECLAPSMGSQEPTLDAVVPRRTLLYARVRKSRLRAALTHRKPRPEMPCQTIQEKEPDPFLQLDVVEEPDTNTDGETEDGVQRAL